MPVAKQPAHHVPAHAAEADETDLHEMSLPGTGAGYRPWARGSIARHAFSISAI